MAHASVFVSEVTSAAPRRTPAASRVEEAALELFYEHGFKNTSVRDIMGACQLTGGGFYNHFRSKDALLYDIARTTHDLCDEYLYRGIGRATEPRGQLWHLTYAIAQFHAENVRPARVTSRDFLELPNPELADIRERRRRVLAIFEHVLSSGVAAGVFDSPRLGDDRAVRLLATAITNMAIRIADWYAPSNAMSVHEIAAFHGDVAIRMTRDNDESDFVV